MTKLTQQQFEALKEQNKLTLIAWEECEEMLQDEYESLGMKWPRDSYSQDTLVHQYIDSLTCSGTYALYADDVYEIS
jgi:hypothetical protein